MVWTTPRTWVSGELVTASIMNAHVRDNLSDLDSRVDDLDPSQTHTFTALQTFNAGIDAALIQNTGDIELDASDDIIFQADEFRLQNDAASDIAVFDLDQDHLSVNQTPTGGDFLRLLHSGTEMFVIEDNKVTAGRTLLKSTYGASGQVGLRLSRSGSIGGGEVSARNANDDAYRVMRASAFTVSSDRGVKTDIEDVKPGIRGKLAGLKAKRFRRRDPDGTVLPGLRIGFIAQDLPDAVLDTDADGELVFDLSGLLALIWDEMRTEVDSLKARVAALEAG